MNILINSVGRFAITPDGRLWAALPSDHYAFYTRYLDVFDSVRLLARAEPRDVPPPGYALASGLGVIPVPLPYYQGPREYLRVFLPLRRVIDSALREREALCFRLPCSMGSTVLGRKAASRPYGVEVIADPYDTFSPGAHPHPLRPFFRQLFSRRLRKEVAGACAASYVTREALQRRYRPGGAAFTTNYSSIDLAPSAVVAQPRAFEVGENALHIISVGAFTHLSKAPDVTLKALKLCIDRGCRLTLSFLGSGLHLEEMRSLAHSLGLEDKVKFLGQRKTGQEVYDALDSADLFVLPSRQEGVPRAMIEAMARGLPCIGSTVGGIPELLLPEEMVSPNDPEGLASRIEKVVSDRPRMTEMSARNLRIARGYIAPVLAERRRAFYRYLRNKTEMWLGAEKPSQHELPNDSRATITAR